MSALADDARCYLRRAFTSFQLDVLDKQLHLEADMWVSWFRRYRASVTWACSLNYDMAFERMMQAAEIDLVHVAGQRPRLGVPFLKPHHCVSYAPALVRIPTSDPTIRFEFGSQPYRVMGAAEMRLAVNQDNNFILPGQPSWNGYIDWVRDGYDTLQKYAPTLSHLLVIGVSNSPADRDEIREITDPLPRHVHVVMVNPYPPMDWVESLRSLGHPVTLWRFGPRELPSGLLP